MKEYVLTSYHGIEEALAHLESQIETMDETEKKKKVSCYTVYYYATGRRVKRIIEKASSLGVEVVKADFSPLEDEKIALEVIKRPRKKVTEDKGEETLETYLRSLSNRSESTIETLLILDGITDVHNVAAIIRNAVQFKISAIILAGHGTISTKEVLNNKVIEKVSAGAVEWMKFFSATNCSDLIEKLKKNGFWIYATDMTGESLEQVKFANRSAIIMGSESVGVGKLAKKNSDVIVSIPTPGMLDSLNVSVSSGIVLYERWRQFLVSEK